MKRVLPWILFLIIYLSLKLYYQDLVPIWDGRGYYDHLELAVHSTHPFWERYSFFGHSSLAWALLCSIPLRIFPGNIIAFNAFLLGFDCLVLFSFYRLIKFFASRSSTEIEKVLILSIFAFNPIILATQLNFSLDTGLLGFFVIYLYLWVERKFILAALVGCLMSLTKEPGLALCLIFPVLEFIFYFFKKEWNQGAKETPYWLLIGLPVVSFASYVYLKWLAQSPYLFWKDSHLTFIGMIKLFLNPFTSPIIVRNTQQDFLFLAFIANFTWVVLCILVFLVSFMLYRRFQSASNPIGIEHIHLWAAFFPVTSSIDPISYLFECKICVSHYNDVNFTALV